jgi:fatty acid desaturase
MPPFNSPSVFADRHRESRPTHTYSALADAVRTLDLHDRTRGFYALVFAALVLGLGCDTGLILLRHSWLVLLVAGALGVIFTQFAFLGHEASHRQIPTTGPANDWIGRVLATLFVGIATCG